MGNNQSVDWASAAPWQEEIERSRKFGETHWTEWEENLRYFKGKSPDAVEANAAGQNYINVNADFTAAEVKKSQLFFETPELQLSAKGIFKQTPQGMPGAPPAQLLPADAIIAAHRELLNDFLGPDHADVLPTIHKVILDCLVTAGVGATMIGFQAFQKDIPTPPEIAMKFLSAQPPQMPPKTVPQPLAEMFYWLRIPSKKYRIPADFADTDFDKAPWLGYDFRLPTAMAAQIMNVPPEYQGKSEKDKRLLQTDKDNEQPSTLPYIEGTIVWYYASLFDEDVANPYVMRQHIFIEGVEGFCEKNNESPYQTVLPNGRLSADSMIGNPIHVLAIRSLPDSAFVPSDSSMIRPLVRELCTFRTQQVQERDANIPRILYDATKILPEVLLKIQNGSVGSLIGVPGDALMNGIDKVMAQVVQGTQTRGSYQANDYIQHDLDRTLGMDSIGAGVAGESNRTATEVGTVDKVRSMRLDHERGVILAWYLKGVQKFSSLVCRFLNPQLATSMVGPEAAQLWGSWDKKTWDGRFVIKARPDSQIKLDAASERKFALDLYQFVAKDPMVNRSKLLESLFQKAGLNPTDLIVPPPEPKKPDPSIAFSFKGEDFLSPAAPQVREIIAQCGIQISQNAITQSATQLLSSLTAGTRDANGKAVPAAKPGAAQHGGTAEQVRPLSQQSADQSGQRPGVKPQVS